MNKKNKILAIVCSSLSVATITVGSIAGVLTSSNTTQLQSSKDNHYNDQSISYNGVDYKNVDSAANQLLLDANKDISISSDKYIGSIGSLQDNQNFASDLNKKGADLFTYDVSKVDQAYQLANGQYTDDFATARNSFVNGGLVTYKFLNDKGEQFDTESQAKESNKNNLATTSIEFYKIKDQYGQEELINPLNTQDQNFMKQVAVDDIMDTSNSNSWSFSLKVASDANDNNTMTLASKYSDIPLYNFTVDWDAFYTLLYNAAHNDLMDVQKNKEYSFGSDNLKKQYYQILMGSSDYAKIDKEFPGFGDVYNRFCNMIDWIEVEISGWTTENDAHNNDLVGANPFFLMLATVGGMQKKHLVPESTTAAVLNKECEKNRKINGFNYGVWAMTHHTSSQWPNKHNFKSDVTLFDKYVKDDNAILTIDYNNVPVYKLTNSFINKNKSNLSKAIHNNLTIDAIKPINAKTYKSDNNEYILNSDFRTNNLIKSNNNKLQTIKSYNKDDLETNLSSGKLGSYNSNGIDSIIHYADQWNKNWSQADANNIPILKDADGTLNNAYYFEYYAGVTTNDSYMANDNRNWYFDTKEAKSKNYDKNFYNLPLRIAEIFDVNGNMLNEQLLTGDSLYDDESTMTLNVVNNFLLSSSQENKVFYNLNGSEQLIDNEYHYGYEVTLANDRNDVHQADQYYLSEDAAFKSVETFILNNLDY